MFAKVHERKDAEGNFARVVALCDGDLLGKVLEEGGLCLDLKRSRAFYEGKKVSKEEAVELLKSAQNANIVGAKSVACAKIAFGKTSAPLKIAKVPHLQVYRV